METTFPKLLLHYAQKHPEAIAMREKKYGIWQSLTWQQLLTLVEKLACALHEAGLQRGATLIIIGSNRPRLYASMIATQCLGAIPIPLYQDANAHEYVFPINNAEVDFAVVEDQEQVDKLLEIREQCPEYIQHIYYDESRGMRNYHFQGLHSMDHLEQTGTAFAQSNPDFLKQQIEMGASTDVSSIFFTSGTTGNPKGVVHSYNSLIDRAVAGKEFDELSENEEVLAYLPLAWIGQNTFSYSQWLVCGYTINCPESNDTVRIDLKEIGPTYYFAPPKIFESLLTNVMIRMEDATRLKRFLFHYFMQLAKRIESEKLVNNSPSFFDTLRYQIGNWLIYAPLRNVLGFSRVRIAYTAGEAIGADLFTFYRSIGINLKQLYGSTETAVFVCMQPNHHVKPDTVGIPCQGIEIKIADNGEVLVRSKGLLREYFKNPEATREVIDADGWYHTSDAGFLDDDGHLKILDRVKDLGKIKGGVHDGAIFAPKYIENKLKFSPFIKEAVAYGDGRERVCTMVNIDFEAVGNWAERRGLPYTGYTDLAQKSEVYELVASCVDQVNKDLAQDKMLYASQITRFLVLHKELDADDGELTRTSKVKRGFIAEKYQALIDALYSDKTEQFIETLVKFEDGRTGKVSATLKIENARCYETSLTAKPPTRQHHE